MAKFKYRMQNILDIKYKLEDNAKQSLANAMMRLREEEDIKQKMIARRDDYEAEYKKMLVGTLDFLAMDQTANAVLFMNERLEEQDETIKNCSKDVELARKKLNQIIQERKMHETLKEKEFEEFLHELSMQEIKEIDEVVSYQYGQEKAVTEE